MTRKLTQSFFFSIIVLIIFSNNISAQIDSAAVAILDRMSLEVGSLKSCSLTLKTESDILDNQLGLVTHSETANVYLKAPDKLFISKSGDKGNKEFYYDGKTFTYYSKNNNVYSSVPAPPTIMQTIDSIHNTFGIDFPAADFFYPNFVEDVMDLSSKMAYLGTTSIDSKGCYHIAGTTKEFTYQMWIANDGSFLPVKMSLVYIDKDSNPHYTAMYDNWNLNPTLQDTMFNFTAPSDALKVRIAAKK